MDKNMINRFVLPEDLKQALDSAEKIIFPKTKAQLVELCYGPNGAARFNVSYDISEKESYVEADVVRCKNGPSVNFTDAYMRRRDVCISEMNYLQINRNLKIDGVINFLSSGRRP